MIYRRGTIVALCIGLISVSSAHLEPQDFPPEFVRVAEALRGRVIPDLTGKSFVEFKPYSREYPQYISEDTGYHGWLLNSVKGDELVVCVNGTVGKPISYRFTAPSSEAVGVGVLSGTEYGRYSTYKPEIPALLFYLSGENETAQTLLVNFSDWSKYHRNYFAERIALHIKEVLFAQLHTYYMKRDYNQVRDCVRRLEILELEVVGDKKSSKFTIDQLNLLKREMDRRHSQPDLENPILEEILKMPGALKYQGLVDGLTNYDGGTYQGSMIYEAIIKEGLSICPYLIRAYGFDERLTRDWVEPYRATYRTPSSVSQICFLLLTILLPEEFDWQEYGTPEFRREKAIRLLRDWDYTKG